MSRRPKLPTLPAPPADASPQQRSFFQAIKQQLDALVGQLGERDRAVTFRDLEDGGLARLHADGYTILPGQEGPEGPPGPQGDPGENGTGLPTVAAGVIPPAVTGLKASAAYSSIILTWNDPDWPAGASTFNVAYFEIFRATSATPNPPVPDASYSFGQTRSLVFSDLAGTSKTYYYWVRIVGKNNEIGPVVGPVSATTSPNVPQLLDVLTGQLSESQLVASLNDRIDLVDDSGTLATSVTARIAARESIIRTDFAAADSSTLASAQTYVQNWAYAKSTVYTKTEADSAITTQVNTVNARLNTGGDTYNSIAQAQTLASSKNATFVQSTAPTATKLNDLWIHTGDNNRVYRWNNSAWVLADDQRIGSISSQLTTLQSRFTATQPAIVHSWESGYTGWTNTSGSAEASVISSVDALVGGKVLQLGNNSGNDQWWGIGTDNIPLDNNTTYKITARHRRLLGAGAFYLGFAGIAADGTTYVNSTGANSNSSQFYTNTAVPANTDWIETVGYLKVGGSGGINNNSLTNPIGVHANVRYIRPLMIAGYQNLPGQWEIDYIKIEPITNNVASLQVASNTYAGQLGDLEAQYTVKVDVNGYVSGFGLASTLNNATPFSEFAIVADKFSIAPVATNPATADGSPFFHLTAPTAIDGVTVPAGTYMKRAYIHNAAINTAQIKDAAIDTAKIADAAIVEAKIGDLQVTTAKIDDAAITTAKIGAAQITTALIENAAITDAKIGLAEITGAKIANATITDANINSLNADKITAGTLAAGRIAAGSITGSHIAASTILAGNIAGGQITAAKMAANSITAANGAIADLAVTTFKIGNNAVTVPASASGTTATVGPSYASLCWATATMAGSQTLLIGQVNITATADNTNYAIRIYRSDGYVYQTVSGGPIQSGSKASPIVMISAPSGAGTYTYYLQAAAVSGAGSFSVTSSTLSVLETKK